MSRDHLIAEACQYAATHGLGLSFSQARRLVNKTLRRMEIERERVDYFRITTGDDYSTLCYSDRTGETAVRMVMREIDRMTPASA